MHASPTLWAGALGSLALAGVALPRAEAPSANPIFYALCFLAAWLVATNEWSNPSHTAAAAYHAAFIVGGYLLGLRWPAASLERLYGVALAGGGALALWAIWQRTQGIARPTAVFETPATLAAVLNMVFLPGMVLVLLDVRRRAVFILLALIATALILAGSRGGWLGFVAGATVAVVVFRRARIVPPTNRLFVLGSLCACGAGLAGLASTSWQTAPGGGSPGLSMFGPEAVRSSVARLELYEFAAKAIEWPELLRGTGYLGFYYLLETGRGAIATYEQGVTYFVHNDYLQVLLELGLPGLVALVALVFLPLWLCVRAASGADRNGALIAASVGAALASMGAHAMVDYPFYVPMCLLLYGIGLGVVSGAFRRIAAPAVQERRHGWFVQVGRGVLAAALIWVMATPVLGELAARYAQNRWQHADGERAAYWFEVARHAAPRDWRYHWYAGQFWFSQATQNRKPEAARLADQAFADGLSANPREVRNLLGRIATQVQLRSLLDSPVKAETLLAWADLAAQMAPLDPVAQIQRKLLEERLRVRQ